MQFRRIIPNDQLFPYVESFWTLDVHAEDKGYVDFKEYSFFANPFPQIVFQYLGKGFFDISILRESRPIPTHHFYGQSTKPITLATFGSFGCLGINFYPYAIPLLFDLSSESTTGKAFGLQQLFGTSAPTIISEVLKMDQNDDRIDYLSELLAGFVVQKGAPDPIIEAAMRYFLANDGRGSIEDLCSYLGYSVRQVERSFKDKIGISPKMYARIIRFHGAIRKYHQQTFSNLSQLALSSGFSDQAHFIREFQHFAGIKPRHYFKELNTDMSFIQHV